MGGTLSKESTAQPELLAFDGLNLSRPKDLPSPTTESRKKLTQLYLANHHNFCVLYSTNRKLCNPLAQALISAYYLGATPAILYEMYERLSTSLDEWKEDSPQEVTRDDWQDFLGNKDYVRSYYDYFRDEIQDRSWSYEWKNTVKTYLIDGYDDDLNNEKGNLFEGLLGGFGNSLTQLGYATEINNWEIAAEALILSATEYNTYKLDKLLYSYPLKPTKSSLPSDPLELLNLIHKDTRLFVSSTTSNPEDVIPELALQFEEPLKEYLDAFQVTGENIDTALPQLFHAVVLAAIISYSDGKRPTYNPLLLNLLSSLQEIIETISLASDIHNSRELVTDEEEQKLYHKVKDTDVVIPKDYVPVLVKNYWVLLVMVYLSISKPEISLQLAENSSKSLGLDIPDEDKIWGAVYSSIFERKSASSTSSNSYEFQIYKTIRALLFASRYLVIGKSKAKYPDSYFYAKAAYFVAKVEPSSLENV